MGFSSQALIRLHNLCLQHDADFDCEDDPEDLDTESNRIEEPTPKTNQQQQTHNSGMKDHETEAKDDELEGVHRQSRKENASQEHVSEQQQQQQQKQPEERRHESHASGIAIVIMSVITFLLVMILLGVAGVKYRQQQIDLRQVLRVAIAAALNAQVPVVPAQAAAVQAPAPLPHAQHAPEVQPPPLAFFPGAADIVSLLGYIALDRVRRRLTA
jgi:cation transport ATPase